jgi:hypothetical protein
MTPADNSHHLAAAATRRSAEARRRAENALLALRSSGQSVSVSKLAKDAGVAQSWLYTQPDLIAGLRQLARQTQAPRSARPAIDPCTSASLPPKRETNGSNSGPTPSPSRTTNSVNNSNVPTPNCVASKSSLHPPAAKVRAAEGPSASKLCGVPGLVAPATGRAGLPIAFQRGTSVLVVAGHEVGDVGGGLRMGTGLSTAR